MIAQRRDPPLGKELSQAKRLLLQKRLAGDLSSVSGVDVIPRRPEDAPIPLTFAQESIWFIQQMQPQSAAYNMHHVVRLTGPLDATALARCFQSLIQRHQILRATFVAEEGRPIQVIAHETTFALPVLDLRKQGQTVGGFRTAALDALVQAELRRPFDLAHGPLLRALLLQTAADEHILAVTIHHIIFDDWSSGIFWRELSTLYRQQMDNDQPLPLPELPVQYADFAVWQREYVRARTPVELAYWKRQLDVELTPLLLPADSPRPPQQTFAGRMKWRHAPDDLYLRLQSLNQTLGATSFMTLLACFQLLLHRYTGQIDILVGYPMANRARPETSDLIGLFLNTLVMRLNFAGNPRFDELMAQVRQAAVDGYAHQNLPFEKLVDELHAPRYESYNPLFQAMFVHQKSALDEIDLPGVVAAEMFVDLGVAKFDLTLFVQESANGLDIGVEYNSDLFQPETIDRVLGHYLTLLASVVNDPTRRVSQLEFITTDERRTLLHEWNDAATLDLSQNAIHELIEAQARQKPETTAVSDQSTQLTHGQLHQQANQLAHHLIALGVRANTPVGLLLERSTDMIVAILGVLKAGGAYLPLDPAYPPERLSFILADARAPVVVTHRKLHAPPTPHAAQIVRLDDDWGAIAGASSDPPSVECAEENLAYIIYTSGSTGAPKGVPVTHRNLLHSTAARFRFYQAPVERFLLLSPFVFDSSVAGIFWTLCQGGTLVLPPARIEQDLQRFAAIIAEQGITHTLALPTLYGLLLEHAHPADLATLTTVIVAGEECRAGLTHAHYEKLPRATLYNEYGPTEATVWSTAYKIPADFAAGRVPIGRPIPGAANYILDQYGQPTPIGVAGELCIAGPGVTAGYLNHPELTGEQFAQHSFAGQKSIHIYRTGDLARFLPDGNIEYLGRMDHQVKIHGVRVEPGEVEAALSRHPKVQQCAVIVPPPGGTTGGSYVPPPGGTTGGSRLAAYVQLRPPTWGDHRGVANELRSFLLGVLPEIMVPSSYVVLDELPLTPNGKLDRRRLPPPEIAPASSTDAVVAPRTWVEETLAAIWAEVLGRQTISVYDNFFDLGGDSILSIQIMAKAARHKIKLKPNDIFRSPTVAGLASVAAVVAPEQAAQDRPLVGPLNLTPIQHWFFEQELAEAHHWNQSYLLQLAPGVDLNLIERTLQYLYLYHDALRLRFWRTDAGWSQEYAGPEQRLPLTRVDLSHLPAADQPQALTAAATQIQGSLSLTDGRLVAAVLFTLGADQAPRLLLVIHHLAIDAVSWQILLEDFEAVHGQLQAGREVQLPPKTSSYQQWAARLAAFAQTAALDDDLTFWEEQRAENPWPGLLDDDPAAGSNSYAAANYAAANIVVTLTAAETDALLHQVPAAYQTQINDVLLAALLLAFSERTAMRSLTLDLEGHGREGLFEEINLSRTVGWFTTVFPVRLHLPPGKDMGQLLMSVKEQLRRTPAKGLSYGVLRYLGQGEALHARLAHQPASQLTFNYLGQFDQSLPAFSLFHAAPESPGVERSPFNPRRYLLEINGMVKQGRLAVNWGFGVDGLPTDAVESLANSFVAHLRRIIAHCTTPGVGGYTPSDFPLARLDQRQIESITRRVDQPGATNQVKNVDAIYPLSPMQESMLLHTLAHPESRTLCTQVRYTLAGGIDVTALRRTWQGMVNRHPALRTGFDWEHAAAPLQVVRRQAALDFSEIDLRQRLPAEQQTELARVLAQDSVRGFDLACPPLVRLTLIHLADDRAELVLSSHHLVVDRWCSAVLLAEMLAGYANARGENGEAPLPSGRSFSEYIAWLQRQDETKAETFWRRRLAGFQRPTLLTTPVAFPSVVSQATLAQSLSPAVAQALHATARQRRLTIHTVAQGVLALLLGHRCQTDDVFFGVTVAGRPPEIPGVESIIGSFINNLPARVAIQPAQPLWEWLSALQAEQLAMQPYEYVGLAKIHSWSDLPAHMPLFDTLLIAQPPIPAESQSSAGISIAHVDGSLSTNYPFALSVMDEAEQFHLEATFSPEMVDRAKAAEHLDDLARLMEAVAQNSDQLVGELLALLGDAPPASNVWSGESPRPPQVVAQRAQAESANTDTERRLVALWESLLGLSPIGVQDNFFALGGTSLQALRLFSQIGALFGKTLPLASLIEHATVRQLARLLQEDAPGSWSSLTPMQPQGSLPPFYCIHGLTGDVLWFRELGRCLAPDQPLYGLQARGLDGVSPPFDSIEAMAAYYVEQVRAFQPRGPYYLGGASLGGTIALEMAQQFLAQGEEVGLLVMFDHAPNVVGGKQPRPSPLTLAESVGRMAANAPFWLASFRQLGPARMVARARRKLRNALRAAARAGRRTAAPAVRAADLLDYGAEMPPFRQRMIAAHHLAAERYAPRPYAGRITLFQARAQPLFTPVDPLAGWRLLGQRELDFEIVAGSHEGMFRSPNVEQLAQKLRARLAQAVPNRADEK